MSTGARRGVAQSGWRFLVVGGTNTAITTGILIGLSYLMAGWIAYTIAFGLGLVYSTFFASRWVFTRQASWRATGLYAASYVVIYLVGLVCVAIVHALGWPEFLNGLSVLVTAPLGFVAGRIVFRERRREARVHDA